MSEPFEFDPPCLEALANMTPFARGAYISEYLQTSVRWTPQFTRCCYFIMKSIAEGTTHDMERALERARATADTVPFGYKHLFTVAQVMELACEISGNMYAAYKKNREAKAEQKENNTLGLNLGHSVSGSNHKPQARAVYGYVPYSKERPARRQRPVDKTRAEVKESVDELERMLGAVSLEDTRTADIDISHLCAAFEKARLDPAPAPQPAAAPRVRTVALPDIDPVPPFVHYAPIVQAPTVHQPAPPIPIVTANLGNVPVVQDAASREHSRRPARAVKHASRCRSDPLCRAGRPARCVA